MICKNKKIIRNSFLLQINILSQTHCSKMWSSQKGPTKLWDPRPFYLIFSFMVRVMDYYKTLTLSSNYKKGYPC